MKHNKLNTAHHNCGRMNFHSNGHDSGGDTLSKQNFNFQKIIVTVGISLLVIKFFAWYLTSSVAILTDALESIVNVVAGLIGLYALYLSAQPRDSGHPFGHGRVEIISSAIEGVMICTAGILILFEAVNNIINPTEINDLDIGLLLVAFAAAVNFAVGLTAIRKGKKNRSQALVASGKHLCSDTYSSVGIICGLVIMYLLQLMGYSVAWLDGGIAMIFGFIIIYTGIRVIKESMDTIMDKADTVILEEVMDTLSEHRHDDWIDIHNVRVIKYGTMLQMQMHVMLPREMTVEMQFNEIKEVTDSVKEKFGSSIDLTIMGEPCTDLLCECCSKNCNFRSHTFIGYEEWTIETITNKEEIHNSNHDEE